MRRKHLAAVYQYSSTTVGGKTQSRRTRQLSPQSHGNWWCARGAPSGTEPTVGMQPDARVDASIVFLAEVPVNDQSIIQIGGEQYLVMTVLPRDQNRDEIQCDCQDVTGQRYTLTEPEP